MNIKQRLDRHDIEDIIIIGDIVRKAYNGQFGDILRAVINGRQSSLLKDNLNNLIDTVPLSSDRILGRLEAMSILIDDLELMIHESEQLKEPIEEEGE